MTGIPSTMALFERNRDSVYELLEFDHHVLDMAVEQLKPIELNIQKIVKEEAQNEYATVNPAYSLQKTIDFLQNIRSNGSLSRYYEVMYNQCVVLLVSYLAAALKDLLYAGVVRELSRGGNEELREEELKIPIGELADAEGVREFIARRLCEHPDVSFQDMKSINRTFNRYLGCENRRDQIVENLIASQACRHAIVHEGGRVSERLVRQLKAAPNRTFIRNPAVAGSVRFAPESVRVVGDSMTTFVCDLREEVLER